MMATTSQFGISRRQLQDIMSQRDSEGLPSEYEGVLGIAERLHTSANGGLSGEPHDVAARKKEYGTNYNPLLQVLQQKSILVVALAVIARTMLSKKLLNVIAGLAFTDIVLSATVEERKDFPRIEGAILTAVVLILVVTIICTCINEGLIRRDNYKKLSADEPRYSLMPHLVPHSVFPYKYNVGVEIAGSIIIN